VFLPYILSNPSQQAYQRHSYDRFEDHSRLLAEKLIVFLFSFHRSPAVDHWSPVVTRTHRPDSAGRPLSGPVGPVPQRCSPRCRCCTCRSRPAGRHTDHRPAGSRRGARDRPQERRLEAMHTQENSRATCWPIATGPIPSGGAVRRLRPRDGTGQIYPTVCPDRSGEWDAIDADEIDLPKPLIRHTGVIRDAYE